MYVLHICSLLLPLTVYRYQISQGYTRISSYTQGVRKFKTKTNKNKHDNEGFRDDFILFRKAYTCLLLIWECNVCMIAKYRFWSFNPSENMHWQNSNEIVPMLFLSAIGPFNVTCARLAILNMRPSISVTRGGFSTTYFSDTKCPHPRSAYTRERSSRSPRTPITSSPSRHTRRYRAISGAHRSPPVPDTYRPYSHRGSRVDCKPPGRCSVYSRPTDHRTSCQIGCHGRSLGDRCCHPPCPLGVCRPLVGPCL